MYKHCASSGLLPYNSTDVTELCLGAVVYKHCASSWLLPYNSMDVTDLCLGAVVYKHCASSGLLPYNSIDVTDLCLHLGMMCQLIKAQRSCFINGCSTVIQPHIPHSQRVVDLSTSVCVYV